MAVPASFSWLGAWEFSPRTWNVSEWRASAREAITNGAFASPFVFLRRTLSKNGGLAANLGKYLSFFAIIFVCSATVNRITYGSWTSSSFSMLLTVGGLACVSAMVTSCLFPLSNGLVKDPLGAAGTHDILTSVFHFHPLWLTSRSGSTLQTEVIDKGMAAFYNPLIRFTWLGPWVMNFFAAIVALCTLSVPLGLTLVVLSVTMEVFVYQPRRQKAAAQRGAACGARTRYVTCEKLDYARLSSARTRGPREYGAVVRRLLGYRHFYTRATYPADWAHAFNMIFVTMCIELTTVGLVWWAVTMSASAESIVVSTASATGASSANTDSTWLGWLAGRAARAPVATLGAVIIAVRAFLKSFADMEEHQKHIRNELGAFSAASKILTTGFMPEDVAEQSGKRAPSAAAEALDAASARITAALGDRNSPTPITISSPGGAITTINAGGVRSVVIKPFELRPGDITFVRGVNGSGKSLLMKALAGKLDASTRDGAKSSKMIATGFANAFLPATITTSTASGPQTIAERDDSTLAALSLTGCVSEMSQALDSLNLGEKDAATLGDVMLRLNGLLADTVSDSYEPAKPLTAEEVGTAMVAALDAAGVTDRIRIPAFGAVVPAMTQQILSKACGFALKGLSGGEQQRLRLASLFVLERLRYNVWRRGAAVPYLEAQPARLLLLDEPDHHIDAAFPSVLASLMRTLHVDHLAQLTTVVVMHSVLDVASVAACALPPRFVPRLGLIQLSEKLLVQAAAPADAHDAVNGTWDTLTTADPRGLPSVAPTGEARAPTAAEIAALALARAAAPRSVFVAEYTAL